MKFILKEEQNKKLVFGDVKKHHFFVDNCGHLCQKYTESSYHIITDKDGVPCSGRIDNESRNIIVTRILPEVLKIEF